MTTRSDLDRSLAAWFNATADDATPDYLDEIVERVARQPQRPWWSSLERWLPMDTTFSARLAPAVRPAGVLIVVGLLIAVVVAAVLIAGSQRRLPPPFGLARNGDFVFAANGDIYRFDSAGGSFEPLVTGPSWDFGAGFSRDGTRFSFGRFMADPSKVGEDQGLAIVVANADGSNVRQITPAMKGNCWSDWSPDGRYLLFRTERQDGYGLLAVLDVENGTIKEIDPGLSVRCSMIGYRPPTGDEIIFRGDTPVRHGVFAIRPDGTGLRALNTEHPICDCDTGYVSPDGRYVAVDRWDDSGVRLWLLDIDTGAERLVPIPAGHTSRGGTFSPDGTQIAFPMLHRIAPNQNAYVVAVAPVDGSAQPRVLGPEVTLPAGTDEAFVSSTFTPDGTQLIAAYPDNPTSPINTIWLLPIDGSPGKKIGSGTYASLDIQRLAP
jgi:dipeptidyl aminopeptidase/acylaminoacyl peptidase